MAQPQQCCQTMAAMHSSHWISPLLQGFGMGAGLIMAIGAQNAYVLRAGLRQHHVALTVAACIVIDVMAIAAGVTGIGALIQRHPALLALARWGGVAFLACYGLVAARRAWRNDATLMIDGAHGVLPSRCAALTAVLAVSLLNPHMYLDTVVLLGALAGQQPAGLQWWFAVGAAAASTLWFIALGCGARMLAPRFARPLAWRVLDALVATVMMSLSLTLAFTPLAVARVLK